MIETFRGGIALRGIDGMKILKLFTLPVKHDPPMMTQMRGMIVWQIFMIVLAHIIARFAPMSGMSTVLIFSYFTGALLIGLFVLDLIVDLSIREYKIHTTNRTWGQVRADHRFKRDLSILITSALGRGGAQIQGARRQVAPQQNAGRDRAEQERREQEQRDRLRRDRETFEANARPDVRSETRGTEPNMIEAPIPLNRLGDGEHARVTIPGVTIPERAHSVQRPPTRGVKES